MNRVYGEWRNRVRAEYRSAAVTAGVLHGAIAVGLPRELLDLAARIVQDELDHAELSQACLVALGAPDEPASLDVSTLAPRQSGEGVFADLVDAVTSSFCLGETFAVPLFAAMRERTSHPAVEPMLTRVLRDESVHRQFGWDALDQLLAIDPDGVKARIEARLPSFVEGYRLAYGVMRKRARSATWSRRWDFCPRTAMSRSTPIPSNARLCRGSLDVPFG